MVGLATDGAASMIGKRKNGMKSKGAAYYLIMYAFPLAIDVHCSFHRVCLILVHAFKD